MELLSSAAVLGRSKEYQSETSRRSGMGLNWMLVDFLTDNHACIMGYPVDGVLMDIYVMYSMFMQQFVWKNEEFTEAYADFCADLEAISTVCGGCMCVDELGHGSMVSQKLVYLDVDSLKILRKVHQEKSIRLSLAHTEQKRNGVSTEIELAKVLDREEGTKAEKGGPAQLNRLMSLLSESMTVSPNSHYLNHLNRLLSAELGSNWLAKERAKLDTEVAPFVPICSDSKHTSMLSNAVNIVNNRIVSLQSDKIQRLEADCPGIIKCAETHIHFIPNIKPQTDLALGDCSYLDTCHKLSTCRYVHYLQYCPDALLKQKQEQQRNHVRRQSFWTHGECCSSSFKELLPPQWIKCDVRKFDFNILGKFSAVVADPAWNIHMNLPYGTCNDNELLQLPFDLLQDEGLLFLWVTGRAIELGKESLKNWGYEVLSEISWIKTNQLGRTIVTGRTGHWLNHSKEHLLVGLKGSPAWLNRKIDIDLMVSSTRETSRKPDELYGIIERLVGIHARKLEIFGRDHNIRPGWFTIGNQVTGSSIHEMDVRKKYDRFTDTTSRKARTVMV